MNWKGLQFPCKTAQPKSASMFILCSLIEQLKQTVSNCLEIGPLEQLKTLVSSSHMFICEVYFEYGRNLNAGEQKRLIIRTIVLRANMLGLSN